jgi:hypothetical protein
VTVAGTGTVTVAVHVNRTSIGGTGIGGGATGHSGRSLGFDVTGVAQLVPPQSSVVVRRRRSGHV